MDAGMQEEVEAVLETIRPSLMADGGNVELVDIDDGVVKLRLVGSCSSCSSSTMTLKMGIERALKKAIPMVRCIEAIE
jgi:Fe-S cluster biogenesis protein NfuA